jgi:hypothetical protein
MEVGIGEDNQIMSQSSYSMDIGTCCFCGDECNPCSQSCGSCTRSLSGFSLGWNPLPLHLRHVHDPDRTLDTLGEKFRNDEYNGQVYYIGIGTTPQTEYMSELAFRRTIWLHLDDFNEKCPYDPRTCSLQELVQWAGAELVSY